MSPLYVDGEGRVGGAQRTLHVGRGLAAGEQEPKVAVALGQRHHLPTAGDGDVEAGDPGDCTRRVS